MSCDDENSKQEEKITLRVDCPEILSCDDDEQEDEIPLRVDIRPEILELLMKKCSSVMYLKIFIDDDIHPDFHREYAAAVKNHNEKVCKHDFPDAGFDVLLPPQKNKRHMSEEIRFFGNISNRMNFGIQMSADLITSRICSKYNYCMKRNDECIVTNSFPTGYYLYARSSLGKTPLRLSNQVGIIDSGYRGSLIGLFDASWPSGQDPDAYYLARPLDRMVQICAPMLCPIFVEIVDSLDALGKPTERNTGGFGSTNVEKKK
jgi:dUTPase